MEKYKVLFVCVHNSARSQVAETFLNSLGSDNFIAESAGLEPGKMNPNVVAVMKEKGFDLTNKATQSVFELHQQNKQYDVVITVCDGSERCPVFPGKTKRVAWTFPDPSSFSGPQEEILELTRVVRDQIEWQVNDFIKQASDRNFWL